MLSSKDIVPIAIFIVVVYLFSKVISSTKKEHESVKNEGGLVALTDDSMLLVTDSNGNLSTYSPAKEGFKTNVIQADNMLASEIIGTNLTVDSIVTDSIYTSTIDASTINGITGTFAEAVNLDGGVKVATGQTICIGSTCLTEQNFKNILSR